MERCAPYPVAFVLVHHGMARQWNGAHHTTLHLPLYTTEQARRHEVRPGITGWAQINGRNAISWEEKFKLDVWYVDNQSFLLDLKILFLTFYKVIKRKDINTANMATTEPFNGNN